MLIRFIAWLHVYVSIFFLSLECYADGSSFFTCLPTDIDHGKF